MRNCKDVFLYFHAHCRAVRAVGSCCATRRGRAARGAGPPRRAARGDTMADPGDGEDDDLDLWLTLRTQTQSTLGGGDSHRASEGGGARRKSAPKPAAGDGAVGLHTAAATSAAAQTARVAVQPGTSGDATSLEHGGGKRSGAVAATAVPPRCAPPLPPHASIAAVPLTAEDQEEYERARAAAKRNEVEMAKLEEELKAIFDAEQRMRSMDAEKLAAACAGAGSGDGGTQNSAADDSDTQRLIAGLRRAAHQSEPTEAHTGDARARAGQDFGDGGRELDGDDGGGAWQHDPATAAAASAALSAIRANRALRRALAAMVETTAQALDRTMLAKTGLLAQVAKWRSIKRGWQLNTLGDENMRALNPRRQARLFEAKVAVARPPLPQPGVAQGAKDGERVVAPAGTTRVSAERPRDDVSAAAVRSAPDQHQNLWERPAPCAVESRVLYTRDVVPSLCRLVSWRQEDASALRAAVEAQVRGAVTEAVYAELQQRHAQRGAPKTIDGVLSALEASKKTLEELIDASAPFHAAAVAALDNINWDRVACTDNHLRHRYGPFECKRYWVHEMNPKRPRKREWCKEDDAKLLQAVESIGVMGRWAEIAARVDNGRDAVECLGRYQTELSSARTAKKTGRWTPEEDKLLLAQANHAMRSEWSLVAQHIPGRDNSQCMHRWRQRHKVNNMTVPGAFEPKAVPATVAAHALAVKKEDSSVRDSTAGHKESRAGKAGAIADSTAAISMAMGASVIKKGIWTKEEDEQLLKGVNACAASGLGTSGGKRAAYGVWTRVASFVPTRTDTQCRERYKNILNPAVNRGKWSEEEDNKLLHIVREAAEGLGHDLAELEPSKQKRGSCRARGAAAGAKGGAAAQGSAFSDRKYDPKKMMFSLVSWAEVARIMGTGRTDAVVLKRFQTVAKKRDPQLFKIYASSEGARRSGELKSKALDLDTLSLPPLKGPQPKKAAPRKRAARPRKGTGSGGACGGVNGPATGEAVQGIGLKGKAKVADDEKIDDHAGTTRAAGGTNEAEVEARRLRRNAQAAASRKRKREREAAAAATKTTQTE